MPTDLGTSAETDIRILHFHRTIKLTLKPLPTHNRILNVYTRSRASTTSTNVPIWGLDPRTVTSGLGGSDTICRSDTVLSLEWVTNRVKLDVFSNTVCHSDTILSLEWVTNRVKLDVFPTRFVTPTQFCHSSDRSCKIGYFANTICDSDTICHFGETIRAERSTQYTICHSFASTTRIFSRLPPSSSTLSSPSSPPFSPHPHPHSGVLKT